LTAHFVYSVFGLVLQSDFPFPELRQIDSGSPDLIVKCGTVPYVDISRATAVDHGHVWPGGALLQHHLVGKLFISGSAILVETVGEFKNRDLRAFILGPGLGALLYSVSKVPLHVSAIEHKGVLLGITGPSGAGKSTLAYAFEREPDFTVFTDDVAAFIPGTEQKDGVTIHAGPPRIKLWTDSLERFGLSSQGLTRDASRVDKFHLRLSETTPNRGMLLCSLILLEINRELEDPRLIRLEGSEAFSACAQSIYRTQYAKISSDPALLLHVASVLANSLRVYKLKRPRKFDQITGEKQMIKDIFTR